MRPKRAAASRQSLAESDSEKVALKVVKRRSAAKKSTADPTSSIASPPLSPKKRKTSVKRADTGVVKPKRKYVRKTSTEKGQSKAAKDSKLKIRVVPSSDEEDLAGQDVDQNDGPFIDGPFTAGKKRVSFSPSVGSPKSPVKNTFGSSCSIM